MGQKGDEPGDGVGPVDHLDGVEPGDLEHGGDPDQPHEAGPHKGRQRG